MIVIKVIVSTLLFCPFIVLGLAFLIFRKMRMKKRFALGFASDITTFFLFFSVLVAVDSVWQHTYALPILVLLICIGLVMSFLDWRTKKEIEVPLLLKRIWRVYFLLLSIVYVVVCLLGMIGNVVMYMGTTS